MDYKKITDKHYIVDGYDVKKLNTCYNIEFWFCECNEFKAPKPCTPSFCKHTDFINNL